MVIRPVVDVYVIDKGVHPYRKGKRNLGALCEFYGVKLDGAHDATADALAAGRVAWALCRDYPEEVRNIDVHELHNRQVAWKKEQSTSFATYLRREAGKETDPDRKRQMLADADGIRSEWPYIPRPAPATKPDGSLW
jgi:DNA polymerase III epsilon subunit-like protein